MTKPRPKTPRLRGHLLQEAKGHLPVFCDVVRLCKEDQSQALIFIKMPKPRWRWSHGVRAALCSWRQHFFLNIDILCSVLIIIFVVPFIYIDSPFFHYDMPWYTHFMMKFPKLQSTFCIQLSVISRNEYFDFSEMQIVSCDTNGRYRRRSNYLR